MFTRKPNKVAKGSNGTSRTITWKHRNQQRLRINPIFDKIYNLKRVKLERDNFYLIFSTKEEPFVPYEKITETLKNLPEWVDIIFENYELGICLYHTIDFKKESFPNDGCVTTSPPNWFIRNHLRKIPETRFDEFRFMKLQDNSFDYFDDPDNIDQLVFSIKKSNAGDLTHTWNVKICKLFFEWRLEKTTYWFTYTKDSHHKYITEFLLLHELGHLYDVLTNPKFLEQSGYQKELMANYFAAQINPNLMPIFEKSYQDSLE